MRIAVPVENDQIFPHFGHAALFRIYDDAEGARSSREAVPDGQGHQAVAAWLKSQGVDAVLCGGIGDGAVDALREAGILLCSGAEGRAEECVNAFLNYTQEFESGATCQAQEEGGCGGCCGECGGCHGGCGDQPAEYHETRTFTEITTLTKENFEAEVLNDPGLICIDFWAAWCGPCKMTAPVFAEVNAAEPHVKFCRINIDEQPELSSLFGIESVPTFALVQARRTITGLVGACDKQQLMAMIDLYKQE